MLSIVPRTPTAQVPAAPFDRTRAMSRADGCPSCVVNAEPPKDVAAGDDCYYAGYLCTDCGHAWLTTWGAA